MLDWRSWSAASWLLSRSLTKFSSSILGFSGRLSVSGLSIDSSGLFVTLNIFITTATLRGHTRVLGSDVGLRLESVFSELGNHLDSDFLVLDVLDLVVLSHQLSSSRSKGCSHLESELLLLGDHLHLLGANLDLSSHLNKSDLAVSGDDSVLPSGSFVLESNFPLVEVVSLNSDSVGDVMTSALFLLLDSDDFLSLVAPNELGLELLDWSLVLKLKLLDLSLVDLISGLNIDGSDDVVP